MFCFQTIHYLRLYYAITKKAKTLIIFVTIRMCRTSDCTYICPESPPAFLAGAEEADSLLGMEPSVVVWWMVWSVVLVVSVLQHIFLATELQLLTLRNTHTHTCHN